MDKYTVAVYVNNDTVSNVSFDVSVIGIYHLKTVQEISTQVCKDLDIEIDHEMWGNIYLKPFNGLVG